MNTSCVGPLVVPIFGLDFDDTKILVDCVSAREYYKGIYDVVQFGGAGLFSLGAISNLAYLVISQQKVNQF